MIHNDSDYTQEATGDGVTRSCRRSVIRRGLVLAGLTSLIGLAYKKPEVRSFFIEEAAAASGEFKLDGDS